MEIGGKNRESKGEGEERGRRGGKRLYLNFKVDGGHIWVWCSHPGVKVHLQIHSSHDLGLEDVATPSIKPEEPLVQVHVYICGKTIIYPH